MIRPMSDFVTVYKIFRKSNDKLLIELRPKTTFFIMASVRHLELKILNFGHRIIIVLVYYDVAYRISTK